MKNKVTRVRFVCAIKILLISLLAASSALTYSKIPRKKQACDKLHAIYIPEADQYQLQPNHWDGEFKLKYQISPRSHGPNIFHETDQLPEGHLLRRVAQVTRISSIGIHHNKEVEFLNGRIGYVISAKCQKPKENEQWRTDHRLSLARITFPSKISLNNQPLLLVREIVHPHLRIPTANSQGT